jgi:ADP-ribose pyrophosphatase
MSIVERLKVSHLKTGAHTIARHEEVISPWVKLVTKQVAFDPDGETEVYHCLTQNAYLAILARTPRGLFPIVRQYRPAVDAYTWELPAGTVEIGEDLIECCRRELREETGLMAQDCVYLGDTYPDTGRLEQPAHAFFVNASEPIPNFVPEDRIDVEFVTAPELAELIRLNIFKHQLHLGVLLQAALQIDGFELK